MFSGENNNFENDFGYASELTQKLLPILNKNIKGSVVQTEHLKDKVATILDQYSGIDGLYKKDGISGLALRCQDCQTKNWRTFTIRYSRHTGSKTEYEKRLESIISGNEFYPHYTCQAYFDDKKNLLGAGFVFTVDLFEIAQKYDPFKEYGSIYLQTNGNDDNTFIVVPFDMFSKFNKPILEL